MMPFIYAHPVGFAVTAAVLLVIVAVLAVVVYNLTHPTDYRGGR